MRHQLKTLSAFVCSFFISPITLAHLSVELPLNKWHSQRVVTQAIGNFLVTKGYRVNYHNLSVDEQWGALSRGVVHYQLEVWQPSMSKQFEQYASQGLIIDAGTHKARVREEWWFPSYVKKLCPGLPNWQALRACSAIFKEPFSDGKGVYYTGPWQYQDGHMIRALGLNFIIKHVPQEVGITGKILNALSQREPLLILNWTPNWSDVRTDGEFVEFPEYKPECETHAEWGVNPNLTMDCGNMESGWLKKVAFSAAPIEQPCVYEFVRAISFSKPMLAEASAMIVFDKLSEQQAVINWHKLYLSSLESWWPKTCTRD